MRVSFHTRTAGELDETTLDRDPLRKNKLEVGDGTPNPCPTTSMNPP